ncbi:MAG: hypothetical protein ACRD2C_25805 [Acidimicrobiales bacterium]
MPAGGRGFHDGETGLAAGVSVGVRAQAVGVRVVGGHPQGAAVTVIDTLERMPMVRRRVFAGWARREPALAGLDPARVVALLHDRTGDPARRDGLMAALLRLARIDGDAGVLLVVCLLPGVKARLRRHGRGLEAGEAASMMVDALWGRIARYRLDRRPARIAANLLDDTLADFIAARDRQRAWANWTVLGDVADDRPAETEGPGSVAVVFHDAQRAGVVSAAETALIDVTRLVGVPVPAVARHLGVSTAAAHKRRQRAEARLRTWWDPDHGRAA